VVTRGILMIGVRGTVPVYKVVSTRNDPEAHVATSHWWIQLAVTRQSLQGFVLVVFVMIARVYTRWGEVVIVIGLEWGEDLSAFDEELEEPMEDQPLPADASSTALSPGYIADFDPKEDEEDPKEDPADYPADGGDNYDNESSDDEDDDDDVEKDAEDNEEEEHLDPADPSAIPTNDPVPSS
ncbi:hypothetical protein Tco_1011303, partial [Tanacetum coccineum]